MGHNRNSVSHTSLQNDPRKMPRSTGPMHDTKGGTRPAVPPSDGPPRAQPGRSRKAKVTR
jgi:hypothetical protein